MSVGDVLNEALDLYQRFFWRFVATAAVVFVVLDLVSAIGATAGSDSGEVLWALIGVLLSIVGTFWVQGALTEAVNDVRDGRVDTTIGELYSRTKPRLPALIAAGILASLGIGLGLVYVVGAAIVGGVLQAILPDFLGAWLGSLAVHCLTAPFLALAWTVMYFRLAQPAGVGVPEPTLP
jgi:hypothetical protein